MSLAALDNASLTLDCRDQTSSPSLKPENELRIVKFSVFTLSLNRSPARTRKGNVRGQEQIEIQIDRPLSGGTVELIGKLSSRGSRSRVLTWGIWHFALEREAGILGLRIKRRAVFAREIGFEGSAGYFIS